VNKAPLENLLGWYEKLNPAKRKNITIFGGGTLLFIIAALMVTATSDDSAMKFIQQPRKIEYSLFNGKKPRDVTIDAMSGKVNKLTNQVNEMRGAFQRQEELISKASAQIKAQADELSSKTAKMNQETVVLTQKLEDAQDAIKGQVPLPSLYGEGGKKSFPSIQPMPDLLGQPQVGLPASGDQGGKQVNKGSKIRIITGAGDESKGPVKGADLNKKTSGKITEYVNIKRATGKSGVPDVFLPAGSIISGTLVSGMDAPTSNQARHDPFPALLRIKQEAILPNRYRMDVRECFLIASGYGDMSSERAYMRAERISCIKKDGSTIETAMDAFSSGEDGKAGVRGRLVSKTGQVLGAAMLSGAIAGLTGAFAPQSVQSLQTNVIPGQQQAYQYPSPELIAGKALAGGVKGASQQIASYYLEMAKNMFPVIEVDAGRKVDFILTRGLLLQPKSKASLYGTGQQNGTRYAPFSGEAPEGYGSAGGGGYSGRGNDYGR
jgi:conjugal transfer pilus assembly protein TraB